ncbi:MAG: ABC transporter permease subunit [Armatimonadota bacterium]|nr:ABC transporter permease subunit [Armatimonadota bacterium]
MARSSGTPLRGADQERAGRWCRAVLAVCRKEMRETLRDRRTVLAALVLPVVTMPLVVLAAPALAQRQQRALQARPVSVAVEPDGLRALLATGLRAGVVQLREPRDTREAIRRSEIDAAVVGQPAAGPADPPGAARIEILYDESRPASAEAARRLADLMAQDAAAGIRSDPGDPTVPQSGGAVAVVLVNVATPERMGGALLASSLPLFLAVWALLGGQYAALDVGVGERERGTLEALLVLPARRWEVVLGKFLAVLIPSSAALLIALTSGVASLAAGGRLLATGPVRVALPPEVVCGALAVGLGLAAFLSSAQLTLSLAARTLREAQQAFTGLYLVTVLPAVLIPLAGVTLDQPWTPIVPVVNAVWALRGLLIGQIEPARLALVAGTLAGLTMPLLAVSVRQLGTPRAPIR